MAETSIVYKQGRVTVTQFPDVYFTFVSELHKNHQDLLQAMVLGQCRMEDHTAVDYLCTVLQIPRMSKDTPMEIGYQDLLDALRRRSSSRMVQEAALSVAKDNIENDIDLGNIRPDEEKGKPIFPSWDEELERQKKGK
jgi:hypothetical protein